MTSFIMRVFVKAREHFGTLPSVELLVRREEVGCSFQCGLLFEPDAGIAAVSLWSGIFLRR